MAGEIKRRPLCRLERPDERSVTKTIVSPNDGEATVGDVIRYAITVENTGNIDLDGSRWPTRYLSI